MFTMNGDIQDRVVIFTVYTKYTVWHISPILTMSKKSKETYDVSYTGLKRGP